VLIWPALIGHLGTEKNRPDGWTYNGVIEVRMPTPLDR